MTVHWSDSGVLAMSGFSKRFGDVHALEGVGFELRSGEILGLIGPNGAGKTTLFECLAGVLPCDSGQMRISGKQIQPLERASLLFYLPDGITPWGAHPVRWVLNFTIGFFGGDSFIRDELVEQLDLGGLMHRTMASLSKGQRKRVLLAIGLMTPRPVLLADEPFEGLDLRQTREVASILRLHAGRGRTLLLSIHQIRDAARICGRFVMLSGGRVCGEGTLPELSLLAKTRTGVVSADLEEVFLALT